MNKVIAIILYIGSILLMGAAFFIKDKNSSEHLAIFGFSMVVFAQVLWHEHD